MLWPKTRFRAPTVASLRSVTSLASSTQFQRALKPAVGICLSCNVQDSRTSSFAPLNRGSDTNRALNLFLCTKRGWHVHAVVAAGGRALTADETQGGEGSGEQGAERLPLNLHVRRQQVSITPTSTLLCVSPRPRPSSPPLSPPPPLQPLHPPPPPTHTHTHTPPTPTHSHVQTPSYIPRCALNVSLFLRKFRLSAAVCTSHVLGSCHRTSTTCKCISH